MKWRCRLGEAQTRPGLEQAAVSFFNEPTVLSLLGSLIGYFREEKLEFTVGRGSVVMLHACGSAPVKTLGLV
jgi:hypothetical protein